MFEAFEGGLSTAEGSVVVAGLVGPGVGFAIGLGQTTPGLRQESPLAEPGFLLKKGSASISAVY